jgi:hypothetical protein
LRGRVIGQPEISTEGFLPYRNSIRDTFGDSASHGIINKTYSVTHLVKEAQGRYSPAAVVVAVSREVVSGDADQYISTSYVEARLVLLARRLPRMRSARSANGPKIMAVSSHTTVDLPRSRAMLCAAGIEAIEMRAMISHADMDDSEFAARRT